MKLLSRIYELNHKNSSHFSKLLRKISLISISLGLFSILISSFILVGFKKEIKNKIYDFSGHYNISSYSNGISFKNSPLRIDEGFNSNYSKLNFIDNVFPYILNSALIQGNNGSIEGVIFKGVDKNYINNFTSHFDSSKESINFSKGLIISSDLSNKLSLFLGDTATLFFPNDPPVFRKIEIKAIFSTGLEEIDKSIVFGDISLSRKIYGWENNMASGLNVFIKNFNEDEINIEKLNSLTSYDEYIESTQSKYIQIFDWLKLLDQNVIIFFVIILIVACFNMISIVLIIIMDRIKLIGTLKSFGTSKKTIYSIFFKMGFKISVSGIIIGNILSLLFYYLQSEFKLIKLDRENYYIDFVPVDYDLYGVLLINLILFLMILLSVYLPILFIDRIRVINSIRLS
mgnify:FL=1|tara:strand:- start:809 stop:2011 length:1203 start_codon:yes stop_codon:yes gene_type:complete